MIGKVVNIILSLIVFLGMALLLIPAAAILYGIIKSMLI